MHPAEKRQPWATVIPQLAGQAWQAAVASNEPFGESAAGAAYSALSAGAGATVCR
ncbi:hypothetical protein LNO81_20705 [Klebsiella variicola subsp. variicola]|nr:hypothetical protein [Klebsiella variicola subsp. variicola]